MAYDIHSHILPLALVATGFLFGCDTSEKHSSASTTAPVRDAAEVSAGSNFVALALIDGVAITDADVRGHVSLLKRIRFGKQKPRDETAFRIWANRQAHQILPQLVESALMERKFEELELTPSADDVATTLGKFNRLLKTKAKSVDELAPLFGDGSEIFRKQFAFDCKMNALYSSNTNLLVTTVDVRRFYRSATNRLRRCEMINKRSHQAIEAAYARLKKGEEWCSVATNVTEDAQLEPSYAENWKDWLSLSENKIEPDELREALSSLKEGDFTKPIETEEGMVIVRVVSREEDFVGLARILTRLAVPYEIPDEASARKEIASEKKIEYQKSILLDLHAKHKIEFPLGRNFKYELWPRSATENNRNVKLK